MNINDVLGFAFVVGVPVCIIGWLCDKKPHKTRQQKQYEEKLAIEKREIINKYSNVVKR